MPIRTEDKGRYPADWKAISAHIRFSRAGGRCECVGECRTGDISRCKARHDRPSPYTGSLVVLTTAHLDQTPENCDETNLRAMCQRCHLAYDAAQHAATAARTRTARQTAGMTPLFSLPQERGRHDSESETRSNRGNSRQTYISRKSDSENVRLRCSSLGKPEHRSRAPTGIGASSV